MVVCLRWLYHHVLSFVSYKSRDVLLFFKVIRQISESHGTKKSPILTRIKHLQTATPV